jgi:chromosome segregation ATPase
MYTQSMRVIAVGFALLLASSYASAKDVEPKPESYPESAYRQTYQDEVYQIKNTEAAERAAIQARDAYEKKKAQTELDIESKKYQIQNYKLKQQQAESDIQTMQTELQDAKKEQAKVKQSLQDVEFETQQHLQAMDATSRELEANKKNLEDNLKILEMKQTSLAQNINKNQIETEKLKAGIAVLQSQVDDIDATVATFDAEEMKTRTEWLSYKQQTADLESQKNDYLKMLKDSQEKFASAKKDLAAAQSEYAKAEKEKQNTAAHVQTEIAKNEAEIQKATKGKIMAQAEKIRLEAETEKLKAYVAMVKTSKDMFVGEQKDADSAVLQSRLALEKARTELTQEVASRESQAYSAKKRDAMMRGLASAEKAASILDDGKSWTSSKVCKIYERASTAAKEMGTTKPGQKMTGSEVSGGWVKLMNGSSEPLFVDRTCGKFDVQ